MAKAKRVAREGADTHRIRTTINPGTVIEVGDAELTDLKRQGLVQQHVTDKTPTTPAEKVESGVVSDTVKTGEGGAP